MIDKVKIASKNWADDYIRKHGNQVTKLLQCAYTEGFMKGVELSERKHGRWDRGKTMFLCSRCGSASNRDDPYCWHCGAKMDEVEE